MKPHSDYCNTLSKSFVHFASQHRDGKLSSSLESQALPVLQIFVRFSESSQELAPAEERRAERSSALLSHSSAHRKCPHKVSIRCSESMTFLFCCCYARKPIFCIHAPRRLAIPEFVDRYNCHSVDLRVLRFLYIAVKTRVRFPSIPDDTCR